MKLEQKMTNGIQDAAAAFEERIKALLHGKVVNIDRNVATMRAEVSVMKDDIDGVGERLETVGKNVHELKEKYKICRTLAETLAGLTRDFDCS